MPYEGISVSLEEMLEILVCNGRTEPAAVLELERAIEDSRIRLLLPDGTNDAGETMYCKMSPLGRAEVITLLRSFPNRMRTPLIRHANAPLEMIRAARAIRIEFAAACQLRARVPPPAAAGRVSRKNAVRECIEAGMIPASTATWDAFCERVRDLADGWTDKKNGTLKRGFDEKTIKRDVAGLMN